MKGRIVKSSRQSLFVMLAMLIASPAIGFAGGIRHDRSDEQYVALADQPQFESVVFIRPEQGGGGSGVLIGDEWVLTAAHVIEEHDPTTIFVDVINERLRVVDVVVHERADLAILRLASPVDGVAPANRYRGMSEAACKAISVGYGVSGRGDETWNAIMAHAPTTVGTKRAGENVVDQILNDDVLQADFDHPTDARYSSFGSAEPLDLEYFPLIGDSGGGLFAEIDGEWVLIGITIAGVTGPFATDAADWQEAIAYGWISQWQRVSAFNEWIDAHVN